MSKTIAEELEKLQKESATYEATIVELESRIATMEGGLTNRLTGRNTTIANIDRSKFRSVFSIK